MVNKLQNRKILKSEGLVFTSRCVVLLPDPGDRNSLRHKKLFSARPKNVGIISISRTNIADENFEFHSLGRVFFLIYFTYGGCKQPLSVGDCCWDSYQGSFNNYVGKIRCFVGSKIAIFVHVQGKKCLRRSR